MNKELVKFQKAFKSLVNYCAKADDEMEKCMHEVKQEHPEWSQEQRVAVCLNKTGQSNKNQ